MPLVSLADLPPATLHATVVAAMASAVFFTDLGAPPVARHDEDTHTRVALETADAGQWWPLVYHASAYARKPPLKLWLSAATFRWLSGTSGYPQPPPNAPCWRRTPAGPAARK